MEGTSALFALTSGATAVDKVVDELRAYDFEIISTNLPEEQEKQLREVFTHERQCKSPRSSLQRVRSSAQD